MGKSGSPRRECGASGPVPIDLTLWINRHGLVTSGGFLRAIEDGFSDRPVGEDQFDAVVGLFGMLDVIEGRRSAAPTLPHESVEWEGWIFGQESIEAIGGNDQRASVAAG